MEVDENISECDLDILYKAPWKMKGRLWSTFRYLEKMHLLHWIVKPFDLRIENANMKSHLEEELIDMSVALEAKS